MSTDAASDADAGSEGDAGDAGDAESGSEATGDEPRRSSGSCEHLVDRILAGEIDRDDLESAKLDACSEFSSRRSRRNTEIGPRTSRGPRRRS